MNRTSVKTYDQVPAYSSSVARSEVQFPRNSATSKPAPHVRGILVPPELESHTAPSRARNRADRISEIIQLEAAINLSQAATFAHDIGLPLNRFITVNWDAGGLFNNPLHATQTFQRMASQWLAAHGAELAGLWVREAGDGKGDHTHFLWHVPPALVLPFSYRQRGWIKAAGAVARKHVVLTKSVGPSYRAAYTRTSFGRHYEDELRGLVGYLLKATSPETRSVLPIACSFKHGGIVAGKRCATTENIGSSARAAGGFSRALSDLWQLEWLPSLYPNAF